MAYAYGKYAYGICDRCGFRYLLHELKQEWTNFKVCSECYEAKSPQLEPPPHVTDAEALYNPRPDINYKTAALGVVTTTKPGGMTTTDDPIGTDFKGLDATGEVGTIIAGGD